MKKCLVRVIIAILVLSLFPVIGNRNIVFANTSNGNGIYGNGTAGINININNGAYTYFAGKSNGNYAYSNQGCAWFASARSYELTGIDCVISSGSSWWSSRYATYGYTRGTALSSTQKALACYQDHVTVIEKVEGNNVLVSEGGVSGFQNANGTWTNGLATNNYCAIHWSTKSIEEGRSGFLGYVYLNTYFESDTTPPEIKNAHITNATTTSYEVRFNAYDDSAISFAQVGCWSDKWSINNAKWYTVPFSGNYGAITIPISDMGGYKNCWYYCNIYVKDAFGNQSEATNVKVFIDGKAPEIKNAHITNATTTSYEVRFNAYDDSTITFAQVGCWSDKWSINNAKWYTVPFSGNYGAITIPISDMGGYKNCWYYCNIYVKDAFGNQSEATNVKVFIYDHVHQLTKVNAKPATCSKTGNKEYWTCSVCGRYFSDSNGINEIEKDSWIIPTTAHSWNSYYTVDKSATTEEEGIQSIHCSVCGAIKEGSEQVIPILQFAYGWIKENGFWYYVNDSGEYVKGWQKIGGSWYYLDPSTGAMQTGWQKISGTWYYFKSGGAMITGWQKIGSTWYYFKSSGAMVTGWQTIGGKTYFFKSSGAMAANEWVSGYWWLGSSGAWTYTYKGSWHKNSKGWWFGDTSGWYAKNTTVKIDGKAYTFDAAGYMK